MLRITYMTMAIGSFLIGCSASIPVTKITATAPPDHEGVLLVLPRTSLSIAYNVVTTKFTAGKWTAEVEACQTAANRANIDSCLQLEDLGLESKRPSLNAKLPACWDKGQSTETRLGIDPSTVVATPTAIPDPDQIYWVSTPSRWIGDVDVTVKYTPSGTVDGAKAAATNPWADFAVTASAIAIKALLPASGSHSVSGKNDEKSCALLERDECTKFFDDLALLEKFAGDLYEALQLADDLPAESKLGLLEKRVSNQRARFEGSTKKAARLETASWIPMDVANNSGDTKSCRLPLDPDRYALGVPGKAPLECSIKVKDLEVCTKDKDAGNGPREELHASAWITAAGAEYRDVYRPALLASQRGFSRADINSRGFPYRMPVDTRVGAFVKACSDGCTCDVKGRMTPKAIAIAQFGELGRLTPRAGGRKGVIEVDYNGDTGALISVQVTGEGASAKPLTDALEAQLTPKPDVSPADLLKAEKERIQAMAAVCLAYESLAADPPDYCD